MEFFQIYFIMCLNWSCLFTTKLLPQETKEKVKEIERKKERKRGLRTMDFAPQAKLTLRFPKSR